MIRDQGWFQSDLITLLGPWSWCDPLLEPEQPSGSKVSGSEAGVKPVRGRDACPPVCAADGWGGGNRFRRSLKPDLHKEGPAWASPNPAQVQAWFRSGLFSFTVTQTFYLARHKRTRSGLRPSPAYWSGLPVQFPPADRFSAPP